MWVGTGQPPKPAWTCGSATIFWEGQYVFTQKLAAGGRSPHPSSPITVHTPDITQTVVWLGEPV